jgi:hypothetical protein
MISPLCPRPLYEDIDQNDNEIPDSSNTWHSTRYIVSFIKIILLEMSADINELG